MLSIVVPFVRVGGAVGAGGQNSDEALCRKQVPMRSRPSKPAALDCDLWRPNPIDRSQQRHPFVSLTVGQTKPGRRNTSSLFDGVREAYLAEAERRLEKQRMQAS